MAFPCWISAVLAVSLALAAQPLSGQITPTVSPCSSALTSTPTSLSPCLNYITNSSPNGGSPSADCCSIMKSVMSGGVGCLCFIASGGVPFQIPINRNLTLSLPRACQMTGVSVQCKDPVAAPPTMPMSPKSAPGPSLGPADAIPKPGLAPESDATSAALTPPSPTTNPQTPPANSVSRVPPATSAALPLRPSALVLLGTLGVIVFKLY